MPIKRDTIQWTTKCLSEISGYEPGPFTSPGELQATPEGRPVGLCAAKCLTYITTAGGYFFPEEYGAGYVKALAQSFYGIPEFRLIKVTGLDIIGADVDAIISSVKNQKKEETD